MEGGIAIKGHRVLSNSDGFRVCVQLCEGSNTIADGVYLFEEIWNGVKDEWQTSENIYLSISAIQKLSKFLDKQQEMNNALK